MEEFWDRLRFRERHGSLDYISEQVTVLVLLRGEQVKDATR